MKIYLNDELVGEFVDGKFVTEDAALLSIIEEREYEAEGAPTIRSTYVNGMITDKEVRVPLDDPAAEAALATDLMNYGYTTD